MEQGMEGEKRAIGRAMHAPVPVGRVELTCCSAIPQQGTFNTFNKVTGSLGDTISQLSLDTSYRRRRLRQRLVQVLRRHERAPPVHHVESRLVSSSSQSLIAKEPS